MPLPTPKDNESKNDFISRCMGNKNMRKEFPKQDQRSAVCHRRWDNSKEKKKKNK